MTNAPERIWAWWFTESKQDDVIKGGWDDSVDRKSQEYIHRDLYAAKCTEVDDLRSQNFALKNAGVKQAERIAELEADKADLMRVLGEMLAKVDDLLAPTDGEISMHARGQTPDWFVEAAYLSTYGTTRTALKGDTTHDT